MSFKFQNLQLSSKLFNSVRINKNSNSPSRICSTNEYLPNTKGFKHFSVILESENIFKPIKCSKLSYSNDIFQFESLKENSEVRNFLASITKTQKYNFIINTQVIEDIVSKLLPHLQEKNSKIIEANPGIGYLTQRLLNEGIPKIYIIESSKNRACLMNSLYENSLVEQLIDNNLFTTSAWQQKKLFAQLFLSIVESQMIHKIIGVASTHYFITTLLHEIIRCKQIPIVHLCEFYLIFDKYVHDKILNFEKPTTKLYTFCLFQLLFETSKLGEYSMQDVFPTWKNEFDSKEEKLFFVKLKGKKNVFDVISKENIPIYISFLKAIGKSRSSLVIPTLDMWFPDSGVHLIANGITHTTRIGDLNFQDTITLFNMCLKLNSFPHFTALCQGL